MPPVAVVPMDSSRLVIQRAYNRVGLILAEVPHDGCMCLDSQIVGRNEFLPRLTATVSLTMNVVDHCSLTHKFIRRWRRRMLVAPMSIHNPARPDLEKETHCPKLLWRIPEGFGLSMHAQWLHRYSTHCPFKKACGCPSIDMSFQ